MTLDSGVTKTTQQVFTDCFVRYPENAAEWLYIISNIHVFVEDAMIRLRGLGAQQAQNMTWRQFYEVFVPRTIVSFFAQYPLAEGYVFTLDRETRPAKFLLYQKERYVSSAEPLPDSAMPIPYAAVKAMPEHTFRLPADWSEACKDRRFRRSVFRFVIEYLIEDYAPPRGKWLCVDGGQSKACVITHDAETGRIDRQPVPKALELEFEEADFAVVYWARVLAPRNVMIYTKDGDSWLAALLDTRHRIAPLAPDVGTSPAPNGNVSAVLDPAFYNHVYCMRNDKEIVVINRLWQRVQHVWHGGTLGAHNVPIHWPIETFCMLACMRGNDYVDSILDRLPFETLFKAYFEYVPRFRNIVVRHAETGLLWVRQDRYVELVRCAYCHSARIAASTPYARMTKYFAKQRRGTTVPTEEQLRVQAARLSWTLSYFANASRSNESTPDEFLAVGGCSLYGFVKPDQTRPASMENIAGATSVVFVPSPPLGGSPAPSENDV